MGGDSDYRQGLRDGMGPIDEMNDEISRLRGREVVWREMEQRFADTLGREARLYAAVKRIVRLAGSATTDELSEMESEMESVARAAINDAAVLGNADAGERDVVFRLKVSGKMVDDLIKLADWHGVTVDDVVQELIREALDRERSDG